MGMTADGQEVWYRYDIFWRDSELRVVMIELPVIKHTPTGVRLGDLDGDERFVNPTAKSPYACDTPEKARQVFGVRMIAIMNQTSSARTKQKQIVAARALTLLEADTIVEERWNSKKETEQAQT